MGKVAVVTGASGGVGRATVRELAARGYDIGLLARGRAGLDGAAEEVRRAGRSACAIPTDVASWEAVDDAAERITRELGPPDVWVNNAMTTVFGKVSELHPDELRRATEVTYLGQVHGAMAALARMRPRNAGTIVSVGSALAYRGIPLQAPYCGAKFAVRGFMEALRCELLAESSAIRICQVHLPAVNTPQFDWCRVKVTTHPMPVAPVYAPEVPASAIADVVETGARQTFVGSWNWFIVRANSLMPGVGDHFMARTGISGQLTDIPLDPSRPDNLCDPADDIEDHGATGMFGDRDHGVLSPSFLRDLPATACAFGSAVVHRCAEVARHRIGGAR